VLASSDATRVVSTHLIPGERLLWAGRPKQGLLLRGEDAFLIPLALLWTFIMLPNLLASETVRIDPFSLLFLIIGLYLLIGRFLVDAWLRSRTYYAVTDRQAIIVSQWPLPGMRSVSLRTLSDLKLTMRRGGRGTIELGRPRKSSIFGPRGSRALAYPGTNDYLPPAFESISNAREVYDLIVQAQQHAAQMT